MCGSTGTKKTDQRIRVDEKMTLNKILIIGLLLIIMTTMPVMAQLNITHMDDGKTLFTNGSYWIKWDPIDNHVVGDQFFINATTNLSPGTVILCYFYETEFQCHTKICNFETSSTGAKFILGPGNSSGINHISVFINTTGFYASDLYFFDFEVMSPKNPDESSALRGGLVKGLIVLSPADAGSTIKPTSSPLSFAGICGAVLVSLSIFCLIRRNERQRRLK